MPQMGSDLGVSAGAPGGTRTPGRLLRRQLLYPAELQAPGLQLCPAKVTRGQQCGASRPSPRRCWLPIVMPLTTIVGRAGLPVAAGLLAGAAADALLGD